MDAVILSQYAHYSIRDWKLLKGGSDAAAAGAEAVSAGNGASGVWSGAEAGPGNGASGVWFEGCSTRARGCRSCSQDERLHFEGEEEEPMIFSREVKERGARVVLYLLSVPPGRGGWGEGNTKRSLKKVVQNVDLRNAGTSTSIIIITADHRHQHFVFLLHFYSHKTFLKLSCSATSRRVFDFVRPSLRVRSVRRLGDV
jgi:hypothetical protein